MTRVKVCTNCRGEGWVYIEDPKWKKHRITCPVCNGHKVVPYE